MVRSCWRNARFCIVGGPATLERLVEVVGEIGEKNAWTQYDRPWNEAKVEDVRKKRSTRTALWRSLDAEERSLSAFGAHLALDGRVRMNPLLGTGGNAGQRKYFRGWQRAVTRIRKHTDSLTPDLVAYLDGRTCTSLGDFSAGSWFGAANKMYNHGLKRPFRKGEVTPWAMALACEGLAYFAGSPSRQLGSRRQPKGAFPFVTTAMAPKSVGEAGGIEAEIWAPIWSQPMTEAEVKALFLRGKTELNGKGATSPAAFAVAVTRRGVDAGIAEFRRFLLIHTTSAQTFESRFATVVPVPKTKLDGATTRAIQRAVELRDALPLDRKVGTRWRVSGLRGPVEQALVDFSAASPGPSRVEQAWMLVDKLVEALAKVDRNRSFRGGNIRFRLLPGEWALNLFLEGPPALEARLAIAMSSIRRTPTCQQLVAYRLGTRRRKMGRYWEFPESLPARRVWGDGQLTDSLCAVMERRIVETLQRGMSRPPFDAAIRVPFEDIHAWLSGAVDEGQLRLWLDRLCLFDWEAKANREAATEFQRSFGHSPPVIDGTLALYALLRPLASEWLFHRILRDSNIQRTDKLTCAHFGRVAAMLRRGDTSAAAATAQNAYRAAGVSLAEVDVLPEVSDPDRLLAALAIPVRDSEITAVFRRWQSPTQPQTR